MAGKTTSMGNLGQVSAGSLHGAQSLGQPGAYQVAMHRQANLFLEDPCQMKGGSMHVAGQLIECPLLIGIKRDQFFDSLDLLASATLRQGMSGAIELMAVPASCLH